MINLLNVFTRTAADPHSIVIQNVTAGLDVFLIAHAPAVITMPGTWLTVGSRVATTGAYVFRLPAANHSGGNINVSVDLSGSRALAAVAFETDINIGSFYNGLGGQSANATAYGTGLHTFAEKDHVLAIYMPSNSNGSPPLQTASYDNGFTAFADTGWAGSGVAGDEAARVYVAQRDNFAATSTGVINTVGSTTAANNEYGGIIAWDNTGFTPGETFGANIVAENALTGHNKTNFEFPNEMATLPGYADGFSFNVGQTVNFKVDSTQNFTIEIFRLGYYGGAGARRVTTITGTPFDQPSPTINSTTLEADASNWTTNASWAIPSNAVSGLYLAFVRGATADNYWRTPFVVRNDALDADVVVKFADTTWQAYNPWGGKDLYGDMAGFNDGNRSFAVRYDRPIITEQIRPQSSWENAEWPLIQFLERNGYNVKYISTLDVEKTPTIVNGANVLISAGHDEYWSDNVWDAFMNARANGTHLIFMSGNEAFWRVRFTDSSKRMVCYKDTKLGFQIDPVTPTGTWQDTRSFNAATRKAPATLTGSRFIANGIREDALKVPAVYSTSPFWRNTTVASLTTGQEASYSGILGFEWNGYFPEEGEIPESHLTLSSTTVPLTNQMSDINGNNYNLTGTPTHKIILYKHTSGSMVLGLGTIQWSWGLGSIRNRGTGYGVSADIKQATYNILRDMGVVPGSPEAGIVTSTPQTYPFPSSVPVLRVLHNNEWIDLTGPTPGARTPA